MIIYLKLTIRHIHRFRIPFLYYKKNAKEEGGGGEEEGGKEIDRYSSITSPGSCSTKAHSVALATVEEPEKKKLKLVLVQL